MCPACKSLNFKKFPLIYKEGFSEGSIRIGTVSTRTYRVLQQTGLSKIAVPPQKWPYAKPIIVTILFYCLFRLIANAWLGRSFTTVRGGEMLVEVLFYGPIIGIAAITFWHNHWLYKKKFRQWERRCMCQECGMTFSM